MIIVHHLNESRSQRILWLMQELGVTYEIAPYQRNAETRLAPPELKAVHPLGKSPVVEEDGRIIAESAAIIEYFCERYAEGKLNVAPISPSRAAYLHWLHYAEGSAMLPFMLRVYTARLGENAAPLGPRIDSEVANHLGYLNAAYAGREFLVDNRFTGADIQMSFVLDLANRAQQLPNYSNLARMRALLQARPAYQRALQRGGPYALGD